MVSELRLFDEKVEKNKSRARKFLELELESL
jgi:hypothetical protein